MRLPHSIKTLCCAASLGMLLLPSMVNAESDTARQGQPVEYTIASDVFTTLQRTVVPGPKPPLASDLAEISKYGQYGYGDWTFGAPLEAVTRTDIMPALYDGSAVARKTRLLRFFTITDIHVTDKESPNQLIYLQRLHKTLPIGASLYSGVMLT